MTGNERVKKVIQWLISQDIVENQKDLAQKIGYNSTTISHIISGVKSVSNKFVQNLCSLSDKVNPNYLLSDDPVMIFADDRHRSIHEYVAGQHKSIEEATEKLAALQSSDGYLLVPVYNFDALGGMNATNDITDAPAYIEKYVPFVGAHDEDICVHVAGNSMIPTYSPGTLLLIRKVEGWREYFGYGHSFVLFLNDGRRILKEVRKFTENSKDFVLCVSHNKEYEPEELPKSMIVSVYKVIMALTNDGF
nr:LexA family transcriptional regulator [uncultured Alistipes sp.]